MASGAPPAGTPIPPEEQYYLYDPSKFGAIICIVFFGLSTFFHIYQMFRTRTWYFIPFCVGGIYETFGYCARAVNAYQTPHWNFTVFVVMTLGTLLAPTLFAASIYMELGRIIQLVNGEKLSLIKRKILTPLFVTCDIISFCVQAIGGAMSIQKNLNTADKGQDVVIAGLWIQVASFGLFMATTITFWARVAKNPTDVSPSMPWKKHINVLLVASLLIMVRCIFRVIEYTQGIRGSLLQHEIYMYMFDSLLMFIAMLLFHVYHPSEVRSLLKGGKVVFLWKTYEVRGHRSKDSFAMTNPATWNRMSGS